jgi:hypothetical protein
VLHLCLAFFLPLPLLQSFIMGLLLTQVFKVMVGRLRPNFLSRCQPIVPANAVFSLQNITASISETDNYPCSNTDLGMVKDGRQAFPSGQAGLGAVRGGGGLAVAVLGRQWLRWWCWAAMAAVVVLGRPTSAIQTTSATQAPPPQPLPHGWWPRPVVVLCRGGFLCLPYLLLYLPAPSDPTPDPACPLASPPIPVHPSTCPNLLCSRPFNTLHPHPHTQAGHTSISFNLAVYASGYLIWVWHWRRPSFAHRLSFGQEFRNDLVNVLAKAWMLAMLCFAWGVGISR